MAVWIHVDDLLPERGQKVLVFCPARDKGRDKPSRDEIKIEMAFGDPKKCSGWFAHNRDDITHWMALPDKPN